MTTISSLQTLTVQEPPSCIAFCPVCPEYFVVGTYYLHPQDQRQDGSQVEGVRDSQKRSGRLVLYRVEGDEIIYVSQKELPAAAALHIAWSPTRGSTLAVATSAGHLFFYDITIHPSGEGPRLITRARKMICSQDLLVLFLAWHPTKADTVAVTLSDGRVCLCTSTSAGRRGFWIHHGSEVSCFRVGRHELEAWVCGFVDREDGEQGAQVLSGGDDGVMQLCRIVTREGKEVGEVVWRDQRVHQAGVTALLPLSAELVLTGSYDDHIRLVSTPTTGRRVALAELNLEGGVWRLQVLQDTADAEQASSTAQSSAGSRTLIILASCMHAGTRIVRLTRRPSPAEDGDGNEEWAFEVVAKFTEHESMNYGCDVQPTAEGARGSVRTIVSTSFYDKRLCLWRYDSKDAVA